MTPEPTITTFEAADIPNLRLHIMRANQFNETTMLFTNSRGEQAQLDTRYAGYLLELMEHELTQRHAN